ncbi:MAG: glycoside hydrolase family 3 C-terminal domain-containing protein [Bacteroidales bacterium]|nr:glycoside hydrolase family 3 C-terminal domain-containing protein [Bacteroidales bacterium]
MKIFITNIFILISIGLLAQPAESVEVMEKTPEAVITNNSPIFASSAKSRAEVLVRQMTLWEKCMLISGKKGGFHTFGIERLGIPSIRMADGPQGVRNNTKSTFYPCGISLAATWNPSLAVAMGRGLGLDCKARGIGVLLGPGVNIYRSAHCGRNFEYYGEDPFLTSEIACGYITGIQNEGVIATVKHFAANNQEEWRHRTNSVVDERTLNEIYFPVFKNAIKKARVGALMTSYNPLNGVHMAENRELIEGLIREQWGFEGIVMSDWLSTYTTIGCVESGLDLEMPKGNFLNYDSISDLIEKGIVTENEIDEKCINILSTFIRFGLLDAPYNTENLPLDNQECCDIAYETAKEGPVLLKNDDILPLSHKMKDIVILGPNADFTPFGGGSGAVAAIEGRTSTIYSAMKSYGVKNPATLLRPDAEGKYDSTSIKGASVVIICVGFHKDTEKEGADRTYNLPAGQDELIDEVCALNDNVIVIVNSGGEIAVPWLDKVKALLMAWYPGQEGGKAMADILYGKISPSGRLPFTFWGSKELNPTHEYYGTKYNPVPPAWRDTLAHTLYHEGIFVGYRGMEKFKTEPMFPFGFGLTYSTFDYSGLEISPVHDGYEVSFTLKNTGKFTASETAQIYVSAVDPSLPRPCKELKGFSKVSLKPGESRRISLHLDTDAFSYYDKQKKTFVIDEGSYMISVASDAASEKCSGLIQIR